MSKWFSGTRIDLYSRVIMLCIEEIAINELCGYVYVCVYSCVCVKEKEGVRLNMMLYFFKQTFHHDFVA